LYQAVLFRGPIDEALERAHKQVNQSKHLLHWFRGWWDWETRDIVLRLLEQPVNLSLKLRKPNK
jgi:hypothetical protein